MANQRRKLTCNDCDFNGTSACPHSWDVSYYDPLKICGSFFVHSLPLGESNEDDLPRMRYDRERT